MPQGLSATPQRLTRLGTRYTSTDLQIHLRLVEVGLAAALLPDLSGEGASNVLTCHERYSILGAGVRTGRSARDGRRIKRDHHPRRVGDMRVIGRSGTAPVLTLRSRAPDSGRNPGWGAVGLEVRHEPRVLV
jgi:hypothetical protein